MLSWPGGTINIQRYESVAGGLNSPPTATQPQNGWWWNPGEGGRGFFFETQAATLYACGSMFFDSGLPAWYITGGGLVANSYMGSWTSFAGGQALTAPYRPPGGSFNWGSVSIQFASPTTGTLTLPDGRQIPIRRYTF